MNIADIKPGMIVGYPEVKRRRHTWDHRREATGKTLKALVMEVKPDHFNPDRLGIRAFRLTKDNAISRAGWASWSDNLIRLDTITEIIGLANDELMQEARSLLIPDWVEEGDRLTRDRACEDDNFLHKLREARYDDAEAKRQLVAEAHGVSVDEVALSERAKLICGTCHTVRHNLLDAMRDCDFLVNKSSEFGMEGKIREAFTLIEQARRILDGITVESLLANKKVT